MSCGVGCCPCSGSPLQTSGHQGWWDRSQSRRLLHRCCIQRTLEKNNSLIKTRYLAYHQMTQVKDYKIDIFPCHPSQLFILLMEGLSVRISMPIHFVMVYGTLSILKFHRSLFSSATRKQQWLSYALSVRQRWPYVRVSSANIDKQCIHLFKHSRDSVKTGNSYLISRLKMALMDSLCVLLFLLRSCKVNNDNPHSNKTTYTQKWESVKEEPSFKHNVSIVYRTNTPCQSVQLRIV